MVVSELHRNLNFILKNDRDSKNTGKKKTDKNYKNEKNYINDIKDYFDSKGIFLEPSTIKNWYDGKTFPEKDNLIVLADFLDADIDYLYGRSREKSRSREEIIKKTGLNEQTIKEMESNTNAVAVVNYLLTAAEGKEITNIIYNGFIRPVEEYTLRSSDEVIVGSSFRSDDKISNRNLATLRLIEMMNNHQIRRR